VRIYREPDLQVENEPAERITYVRYACMHCDDPPSPIALKEERSEPRQAEIGFRPKVTYVFPDGLKDFIEERVRENPHQPG
jgi:hypothetical protein